MSDRRRDSDAVRWAYGGMLAFYAVSLVILVVLAALGVLTRSADTAVLLLVAAWMPFTMRLLVRRYLRRRELAHRP